MTRQDPGYLINNPELLDAEHEQEVAASRFIAWGAGHTDQWPCPDLDLFPVGNLRTLAGLLTKAADTGQSFHALVARDKPSVGELVKVLDQAHAPLLTSGEALLQSLREAAWRTGFTMARLEGNEQALVRMALEKDSLGEPATREGLHLLTASSVESLPVNWIWQGHFAKCVAHTLDGVPGIGKSMFTVYTVSTMTSGGYWPDGTKAEVGNVLMINMEDDLSRTLRPRLGAAGADLDRVFLFDDTEGGFTIPGDLDRLESEIVSNEIQLTVIDPLMAVLDGKINSYRDQDVRRVLAAVKAMAGRTESAVVLVRHLTKSAGGPAIHRGGGSIGIIGGARMGLLMAVHPKNPDLRVLATVKNNLGPYDPRKSTIWRIAEGPRLEFVGQESMSADELLQEQDEKRGRGRPAEQREEAEEWLRKELADGPVPSSELEARAESSGLSWRTIERVRKDMTNAFRGSNQWMVELKDRQKSIYKENWRSSPDDGWEPRNDGDNQDRHYSTDSRPPKVQEMTKGQNELWTGQDEVEL